MKEVYSQFGGVEGDIWGDRGEFLVATSDHRAGTLALRGAVSSGVTPVLMCCADSKSTSYETTMEFLIKRDLTRLPSKAN